MPRGIHCVEANIGPLAFLGPMVLCVSHNVHTTVWIHKQRIYGATMVITVANATSYLPMQKQSWAAGATLLLATLTTGCAQIEAPTLPLVFRQSPGGNMFEGYILGLLQE